jgi:3-oxoacyl-[acyl-carrier-protein] synthase II
MIAMACASGTAAIGEAFWLVRSGKVGTCLAGGSSSLLNPFYILGFAGLQALAVESNGADASASCKPFDKHRNGFALSDGAGALMLESLPDALTRGATILAEIVGYGVSQDAFDLNRPCDDGAGAELSMRRAVDDAGLTPKDISAVNAHGTGTYVGDLAEAAALKRFLGRDWMSVPVSSVKGAIGHALAAAGVLEAIVGVRSCCEGLVPLTTNLTEPGDGCELGHVMGKSAEADVRYLLSNSFGMGGQNATIVLKRFDS